MNVQEHEMFCEPGLENIRNSEMCWDDVTWRTVWRKHSRNLVTMKWCSGRLSTICLHLLTLRLLSTPDGQQTQPAHTQIHLHRSHRQLYSTDLWHHVSSEAEWHHDASCTHWGCPARRCTLWRWAEVQEVLWGTSSGSQRERGRQRTDRSPPVYLHTFKWDKSLLTRRHQHKHSEEISHVLLSSLHH